MESEDIGDDEGVPVELIDLFIEIDAGDATAADFDALHTAGWPAPEGD